MELWTADRVSARIESLWRAEPGGVVATDADGTLWSGDVGEDLFQAFLQHGRVEAPALEALRREAAGHDLSDAGTGSEIARRIYAAYLGGRFPEERVCELMAWCFAGWSRAEVRDFAREVVDGTSLASRVHGELSQVLQHLRRLDIATFVVSASPVEVVVEAASRIGFAASGVVAARARTDTRGIVLAEVERPIPYADGKVARLRESIGSGRTIYAAFGDNAFDVELLGSARVGIAVRPKPQLRRRAHEVPGMVELSP